ncbi:MULTISPECIES: DUF2339 domain-containing protein [Psychrobacter]|uniref:DUF2339 domain-containing protein n=1 Tax=Psychrobacter TaxID=497 RepID=UPI00146B530D|nr:MULTISPECIES: DUF2339 domain-containing protein [Psychrobacter]
MLYLFAGSFGVLTFVTLLVVVVVLYQHLNNKIQRLAKKVDDLQYQVNAYQRSLSSSSASQPSTTAAQTEQPPKPAAPLPETPTAPPSLPSGYFDQERPLPLQHATAQTTKTATDYPQKPTAKSDNSANNANSDPINPDERSFEVVTSFANSIKQWFFGGNLVVRVGVLVLLVGVVLLLKLLSDYIELSITTKLIAIGVAGLALAGLGLKLAKKRFAYGISLQGAGIATAYLSTFFAYHYYDVLAGLPSFVLLGILSALTVGLALRQNAFPLALLALGGGFLAPILTSDDAQNLTALFGYYLLLNTAIAIIAHFRPWKVLNLLGVTLTFGLAYYLGAETPLSVLQSQRGALVLLTVLHVVLYLFVVIRFAQQLTQYNVAEFAKHKLSKQSLLNKSQENGTLENQAEASAKTLPRYLFPIDVGLLFSVPILAFGILSALLHDINHALTIASGLFALVYLGLGLFFVKKSGRFEPISEGMLALGGGFLALMIPIAFDAKWVAFGWSVQGLALVWFGRQSLRAWAVLFGLALQGLSMIWLWENSTISAPLLSLSVSALCFLATAFILRSANSPVPLFNHLDLEHNRESQNPLDPNFYRSNVWLSGINSQSFAVTLLWKSPSFISFLTLLAAAWLIYVLAIDIDDWSVALELSGSMTAALAILISLAGFCTINRYQGWREVSRLTHGVLLLFYLTLIVQLPQHYEFNHPWHGSVWLIWGILVFGWALLAQAWLKFWFESNELRRYDGASWLGTGILVAASLAHYQLAPSDGVMAMLVTTLLLTFGLWQSSNQIGKASHVFQKPVWFDWSSAWLLCAKFFAPIILIWVIVTSWSYDGVIWGLPYIPILNFYDVTTILALILGVLTWRASQPTGDAPDLPQPLLIALALTSFWALSSILVRSLHAFIGTPLWDGGAWESSQVQTGLTMLWTLIALAATITASKYLARALWFLGIGLLAAVVIKLVLIDLSQIEAIWRVMSFLGAGSLILLIGYLAPIPPAINHKTD